MTSDRQRVYGVRLHVPQGGPPDHGHPLIWLLDVPTTWAPMPFRVFEDQTHHSVLPVAMASALAFAMGQALDHA